MAKPSWLIVVLLLLNGCPGTEPQTAERCGDSQVQEGEECDDGNDSTEDKCLNDCRKSHCGDGFRQPDWEDCDDGNTEPGDACYEDCTENTCGDGIVDSTEEACDDGNDDPTDRCKDCQINSCGGLGFVQGETGLNPRDLAADFDVQTLAGPWSFSEHVNGCNSFIFLFYYPNNAYSVANWESNPLLLLEKGPHRAHYFFVSSDRRGAETHVDNLWRRFESALGRLDEDSRAAWKHRLHFVSSGIADLDGWLSEKVASQGLHSFAIDRRQRLREVGLLRTVGNETGRMEFLVHEAEFYNYEFNRDESLRGEAESVTVVEAHRAQERNRHHWFDLQVPADIESYDHLEIDLGLWCTDHLDDNCGEWDYLAHLHLCDYPELAENPVANTACQPAVPASEGLEAIPAETQPCNCINPYGVTQELNQVCNAEGSGFGDCPCGCGTEVARWITTYHREGRWVTDSSYMLAFMQDRTSIRMHLNSANPYEAHLDFRFSNRGKGSRPVSIRPLVGGGRYNQDYNNKYEPITFDVQAEHQRVELAALITGHGHTAERENCAEFCNHTHHFAINGGEEHVKAHPEAGDFMGCAKQIKDGVVPNQFGTWYLGRGGWCPGMDVKPWTVDISDEIQRDAPNTLTYRSLFRGGLYTPQPSGRGGGFGARLNISSWLVFWE